jgi:ABC-type antimicrobial peptide transport system permease subunit
MFGGLTLVLLSIGVYGTLAYVVARRTKEIGVRLALGARPIAVVGMVLRQIGLVVAAGLSAGLVGVFLVGRLLAPLVFGFKAADPITIGSAAGLLVAVAFAAACIPAIAASRVDPAVVLRE